MISNINLIDAMSLYLSYSYMYVYKRLKIFQTMQGLAGENICLALGVQFKKIAYG